MIVPIPTQEVLITATQTATQAAVSLGATIQSLFPGFDFRTFIGEPGLIIAENFVNKLVEDYGLKKGAAPFIAWGVTILFNVIAALVLNLDIRSAIISGIFIGFQANLYHDWTYKKPLQLVA